MSHFLRPQLLSILAIAALVAIPTTAPAQRQDQISSHQHGITIERFDPKSSGPHAPILLVHGAGGPQGDWRKSGMLEALTGAGYSVFVPHYFELGEWEKGQAADLFPKYIDGLQDVLRTIADLQGVDKQKGIALVGFSLGAYLALGVATDAYPQSTPDLQIKAVIDLYGAMPEFAATHMTTMPPVLILHGAKDESVPINKAYALDKLLSEKKVSHEVKVYPDQAHGFAGAALKDSRERTVEFLKQYLQ